MKLPNFVTASLMTAADCVEITSHGATLVSAMVIDGSVGALTEIAPAATSAAAR